MCAGPERWAWRARRNHERAERLAGRVAELERRLDARTVQEHRPESVTDIIRRVFGPYGEQAVVVAACETGHTFSTFATNGQYLGLFQMGDYARGRYGHGGDAETQARAAYAYFVDSGRDWSPWECKP